jgi:hypothetical protein
MQQNPTTIGPMVVKKLWEALGEDLCNLKGYMLEVSLLLIQSCDVFYFLKGQPVYFNWLPLQNESQSFGIAS